MTRYEKMQLVFLRWNKSDNKGLIIISLLLIFIVLFFLSLSYYENAVLNNEEILIGIPILVFFIFLFVYGLVFYKKAQREIKKFLKNINK